MPLGKALNDIYTEFGSPIDFWAKWTSLRAFVSLNIIEADKIWKQSLIYNECLGSHGLAKTKKPQKDALLQWLLLCEQTGFHMDHALELCDKSQVASDRSAMSLPSKTPTPDIRHPC
jgi:hypothetical protein